MNNIIQSKNRRNKDLTSAVVPSFFYKVHTRGVVYNDGECKCENSE